MYMYMLFVYYVRTIYIHVYTLYGHCLYLYSFACLHNKSSVGVNCFSSSSVILGRNPPSIAAACDIFSQTWPLEQAACLVATNAVRGTLIAPVAPSH